MSNTQTFNPEDFKLPSFIKVIPTLTKQNGAQYNIIRGSKHDGTLIFTRELLLNVLYPVLSKTSFYTKHEPKDMSKVRYEVGLITMTTEFGMVDVPAGHIHGMTQTASMPVKCIDDGEDELVNLLRANGYGVTVGAEATLKKIAEMGHES